MPRRSRAELIAALREDEQLRRARRLKLEAKEKQEQRKRDSRRHALTGAAVLAHASIDASFAATLRDLLDKSVSKPTDRELLADLIHPKDHQNDTAFEPPESEPSLQSPPLEQTEPTQG